MTHEENTPALIEYYIHEIEKKNVPLHHKKSYMQSLARIHRRIERTLKKYQLEYFDYTQLKD